MKKSGKIKYIFEIILLNERAKFREIRRFYGAYGDFRRVRGEERL